LTFFVEIFLYKFVNFVKDTTDKAISASAKAAGEQESKHRRYSDAPIRTNGLNQKPKSKKNKKHNSNRIGKSKK